MTINERAKEFAQENSKGYNPRLVAHAYHCGAVDQQNIDIEKACKAHCKLCEYKIIGGCADHADINECRDIKSIIKAMKGE